MAPAIIAHRGFAGVAPENTVGAALAATEAGADAIEIDVRPAADGTPVVFHDDRLDGARDGRPLTDATGLVTETSLETVTGATVLGREPVPTLSQLLAAVPDTVTLNVELKAPGDAAETVDSNTARERWQPFVDRVVADCDGFGGDLLFSSFAEGALAALRERAPGYDAAPLIWDDLETGLEIARRHDCEAIHPPRNAIAGTGLTDTTYAGLPAGEPDVDLLTVAHEEGRAVNVWTVETWTQFDQLAAAGVDGVVAEYPGVDANSGSA
ncbi:glycerophosphodiester phosphodiesterase [Halobacteria archaeon AArc-dxtr1]|nr:glycerophosphodiester phosphodiesterase [Halobacteria archaeon AArc-dxtr1]